MLRIFRHYLSASVLCLFLCENSITFAVLLTAANTFGPADSTLAHTLQAYFVTVFIPTGLCAFLMLAAGLYDDWLIEDVGRALPRLVAIFAIFIPVVVVSMTVEFDRGAPKAQNIAVWYAVWASAAFAGAMIARVGYVAITRVTFAPRRILVVGVGKLAAEIEYLLSQRPHGATEVVGYMALTDEPVEIPQSRIRSNKSSLLAVARENGVKEIVVALSDRRGAPFQPLLDARMEGVTITSYLSFWERETRRVNLDALDPSWLIYSDGFRIRTVTNGVLKRALDIFASIVLLIITLPTLIAVGIAIKLDSRGPIFYRQDRVGRNGVTFTIYKFRTMRSDAESAGIPQWAAARDPRITRIGWFLRMTRIDELPQILNVLRGQMSFVGPRPERPFFVQTLAAEIPFYSERHRVRPGITGWAQINYPYGASIEDAKAKLSYELYYIKNYSFLFDLLIMLSTAEAVLFKRGAR